jgi:hypothetical protein
MTTSEIRNEFQIHYNAIATMSAPNIDDYELSVYLTKAQLELVKNNYNPDGNKYREGFENSEKRRVDLKELVKDYKSTQIVASTSKIHSDSKFFKIPNDVFLIVYENAKISTTDCYDKNILNVVVKTHDEFAIQISNPFKKPDSSTVWRMDIAKIGSDRVVELVSPYIISEYHLRYIMYPPPIILSNLATTFPGEGLSVDGVTAMQTCILSEEFQREIIDRAVQLALRDYKPSGLETKVQLDQRNE